MMSDYCHRDINIFLKINISIQFFRHMKASYYFLSVWKTGIRRGKGLCIGIFSSIFFFHIIMETLHNCPCCTYNVWLKHSLYFCGKTGKHVSQAKKCCFGSNLFPWSQIKASCGSHLLLEQCFDAMKIWTTTTTNPVLALKYFFRLKSNQC